MQYRRLGGSSVTISAITLGGDRSEDDLGVALDCGVTSFDTAPVYGFGLGEERLGRAIRGRRDRVQVLTKYGLTWDRAGGQYWLESTDEQGRRHPVYKNSAPQRVIEECEESLRRLGTDYIDLYQCHWRDPTTPIEETMRAVERLLQAGKIRAAGVSNWEPGEVDQALAAVPLACDQGRFSLLEPHAQAEAIATCRRAGLGVIVYTPLEKGLLTGPEALERAQRRGTRHPFLEPPRRQRLEAFFAEIAPVCAALDATPGQVVLHWTIRQPGITAALCGASTPEQIRNNARAAELALADAQIATVDAAVARLHGPA